MVAVPTLTSVARKSVCRAVCRVGTVAPVTQHWSIGPIDVARIDSSNFVLPAPGATPRWAVPAFSPSVDEAPIAFSALVIRAGSVAIVVDPWIVDDSPRSRPDAEQVIDGLLAQLVEMDVAVADIAFVINTHIDGIGWNTRPDRRASGTDWVPTFPNARYLFPVDELAAVDRGEPINGSEHLGPLHAAGLVDRVDTPFEVTPGVTLTAAPGHNFGHLAVRIEADDQLAIYPGHLVLSLAQVDQPDRDLGDTDFAVAAASRRAILGELAARRGVLLTTLVGGPGGGIVHSNGAGFTLDAGQPTSR